MHWKCVEIFLNAMVRFGVPNQTIALGNISDQFPNGMVRFGAPHRTRAFRRIGVRLGTLFRSFGGSVWGALGIALESTWGMKCDVM